MATTPKPTSSKQSTIRDYAPRRTVEIVKREVISVLTLDGGSVDLLEHLATVAMNDARGDMNPDGPTKSTYEVTDDLGTTSVTVEHAPNGSQATQPMSVEEAKRALREAQRFEREGPETAVAEY